MKSTKYIFGSDDQGHDDVQFTEELPSKKRSYLFWSSLRSWKYWFTEIVINESDYEAFSIDKIKLSEDNMYEFLPTIKYFEKRCGINKYPEQCFGEEWLIGSKITITVNMIKRDKMGIYLTPSEIEEIKKTMGKAPNGQSYISLSDPRLHEKEYIGGYSYSMMAAQEDIPLNALEQSDLLNFFYPALEHRIMICITTTGNGFDGNVVFDEDDLVQIDGCNKFRLYKLPKEETLRLLIAENFKNSGEDYYYLMSNYGKDVKFDNLSEICNLHHDTYSYLKDIPEVISMVSKKYK